MRMILILAAVLLAACASTPRDHRSDAGRVLFVGNSLTYVGNLPAVYSALARDGGRQARADMIVRGGATLAQRVADRSVERALDERRYTALVLQERGGDLLGAFGPDAQLQSRGAIRELASMAKKRGVRALLLGTYQPHPSASARLVEAEALAASEAGIAHVELSETLRRLRQRAPDLAWLADDGMHPGRDLALLAGLLVHRAIHGSLPAAAALQVDAPIYGARSGLAPHLRAADERPPLPDTPRAIRYPARTVELLLDGLAAHPGELTVVAPVATARCASAGCAAARAGDACRRERLLPRRRVRPAPRLRRVRRAGHACTDGRY